MRHRPAALPAAAALTAAVVGLTAVPAHAAPDRGEAASSAGLQAGPLSAGAPGDLDWFLRHTIDPDDPSASRVDDFGNLGQGDFPLVCDARAVTDEDEPSLATGSLFTLVSDAGPVTFRFGRDTDYPLCGDWDGDGVDTAAVVRGNTFFFADTNTDGSPSEVQRLGRADDFPVVGDWNGDGLDTIGVVRGNTFFLSDVRAGGGEAFAPVMHRFGRGDDFPVVGDWDGNRTDNLGVVRGSTWYLSTTDGDATRTTSTRLSFGRAETDLPVAGDWDGNGTDTPGVVRLEL